MFAVVTVQVLVYMLFDADKQANPDLVESNPCAVVVQFSALLGFQKPPFVKHIGQLMLYIIIGSGVTYAEAKPKSATRRSPVENVFVFICKSFCNIYY